MEEINFEMDLQAKQFSQVSYCTMTRVLDPLFPHTAAFLSTMDYIFTGIILYVFWYKHC